MKPVMYLDVDGVLWDMPRNAAGTFYHGDPIGAKGVAEFMEFALEHFEIRWCTTWALFGFMDAGAVQRLADYTGVPAETWVKVQRSKGWAQNKTETIDADEHRAGRPFVWVEDELLPIEKQWLRGNHWLDRYYHTDVFKDPYALVKTTAHLREWVASQKGTS